MQKIVVVIPAFNEESAVGKVIEEIPSSVVSEIIVANNGSTDNTAQVAAEKGAVVVYEPQKGYGKACLKGLEYVGQMNPLPDIVVFLDADYSDYPSELPNVVAPIIDDNADLVIGSRALGEKERGSMTLPQIFGNWLATTLLFWFYKQRFTDLGPFRAIRYSSLQTIQMVDENFGWTVEMQLKAAKLGMNCTEVPVRYKKRVGKSKVSGTVKGAVMAGYKILYTIFKYL